MSVPGRYLDTTTLQAYMRSDKVTEQALLEEAVLAAEQAIDNALGRRIAVASGTPSARSFAAKASDVLVIYDAVSITSVVEDGTTLTSGDDFQAEPLNGLSAAGESVPYCQLRRFPWGACWTNDGGRATVTVTADWGWAAVPAPILEAAKIVAKDALENREVRHGIVAATEFAGVGSRENLFVRQTVRDYRHPSRWGIG